MTNTLEVSPTRAENTCVCGHTESEHSETATSMGHPCEAVDPGRVARRISVVWDMTAERSGLQDLIEALQMVQARIEEDELAPLEFPFHCEHDTLTLCISPSSFSQDELTRLDQLGFDAYGESFRSYRFGSA